MSTWISWAFRKIRYFKRLYNFHPFLQQRTVTWVKARYVEGLTSFICTQQSRDYLTAIPGHKCDPSGCCRNAETGTDTQASSSGQDSKPSESSDSSWHHNIQEGRHSSHAHSSKSAPILHMVEKVKAAIPDAMKYKRSATAPQLQHSTSSLKETGRLRVEKFRVSPLAYQVIHSKLQPGLDN